MASGGGCEFYVCLNDLKPMRKAYFLETLKLIADTYANSCNAGILQVALTKIVFVNTMKNIDRDIFFNYSYSHASGDDRNSVEKIAAIPSGYYKNMEQLVAALNNAVVDEAKQFVKFQLNAISKEVTIFCLKGAFVELSKALQELLKIKSGVIENTVTSLSYPDINYHNRYLKLRTNLVYLTLTNTCGSENLLAIVPILAEYGELVVFEPKNLEWHEVRFDELHLIAIELLDHNNAPAEIDSISTLTLCFKIQHL